MGAVLGIVISSIMAEFDPNYEESDEEMVFTLSSDGDFKEECPAGYVSKETYLQQLRFAIKADYDTRTWALLVSGGDFNVPIPEPNRRSASSTGSYDPSHYNTPLETFWSPPLVLAARLESFAVLRKLVTSGKCNINAFDQKRQTALHYAVKKHRSDFVKLLLDHGADANITTPAGNTALILACSLQTEDIETVQNILQHTSDHDAKRYLMKTALSIASTKGHAKLVRILLSNGASIDPDDFESGENPFIDAARNDFLNIVKYLYDELNIGLRQEVLDRALMAAVSGAASLEMVQFLVKKGAQVDALSKDYQHTALMEAFQFGRNNLLDFLIESTNDVNMQDARGHTALHYCIIYSERGVYTRTSSMEKHARIKEDQNNNGLNQRERPSSRFDSDIAIKLYRMGYSAFQFNKQGFSPLHLACISGLSHFIKVVLTDFPDKIDFIDENRKTPLMYAVTYGNQETVKSILRFQPNVDLSEPESGKRILHIATESRLPRSKDIVQELIKYGCDVNASDTYGSNAVHFAVAMNDLDKLDISLKAGVDPDCLSTSKGTPLHIAAEFGFHQCLKQLLKTKRVNFHINDLPLFLSPFLLATKRGHLECMKLFLEEAPSLIHKLSSRNMTALDVYIEQGPNDVNVIQLLLDYNFNVSQYLKVSVLTLMIRNRHDRAVQMLINAGAKVDSSNSQDLCPLSESIIQGNLPMVKCLLKANCSVNDGHMGMAITRGYFGVLWCLYQAGGSLDIMKQPKAKETLKSVKEVVIGENRLSNLEALYELEALVGHPRSLMGQSRAFIRKFLGRTVSKNVDCLPLPKLLKNYLILPELDDVSTL